MRREHARPRLRSRSCALAAAAALSAGCTSEYERVEIVGVVSRCHAAPPAPGTTLAAGGDPRIAGGLVAVDEQRCIRELGVALPPPAPPAPADPLADLVRLLAQAEAELGAADAAVRRDASAGRLPADGMARIQQRVARLAAALAALAQARQVPPAAAAAGPPADPLGGGPASQERRDPLWAPLRRHAAELATRLAALVQALSCADAEAEADAGAGAGAGVAREEIDALGSMVADAVGAEAPSACDASCAALAQRLGELWSGPALASGGAPLRAALLGAERTLAALRRSLDQGLARLAWPQPMPLVVAPPIFGLPDAAAPAPGAAP